MPTTPTGARHRAARTFLRPTLSLSGSAARRSLLTVASSGLVLTMAATSAAADSTATALPTAQVTSLSSDAQSALASGARVSVPADITWSVDAIVTAEATPPPPPPPPPAPEPEPEPVREMPTSRSAERAAPAPATAAAPVAAPAPAPAAAPSAPAAAAAATTAPDPAPAPAPAPSASASAIVNIARQYVGTPYVYGGATPGGFDCSGFTQYVYAQAGISLPRSSSAQRHAGTVVSAAQARPGDLVWGPGHVGIYTGGGNHIAARNPSSPLHESPIYLANPVFIRVG